MKPFEGTKNTAKIILHLVDFQLLNQVIKQLTLTNVISYNVG